MKITDKPLLLIIVTLIFFLPTSLKAQQNPQLTIDERVEEYAKEKFPRAMVLKRAWNKLFESKNIDAHFKWSMPARYGLDLNQNGIIELPNTMEYVNNLTQWNSVIGCTSVVDPESGLSLPRFHVQFDANSTTMPKIEQRVQGLHTRSTNGGRIEHGSELPEKGPTTPDYGLTEGDINIMADQFRLGRQYLEWEIDGTGLEEPIVRTSPFNTDHRVIDECLPEGEYTVKMTARDDWNDQHAAVTQTVNVKDFLIVQLGDSFASGNGVPERQSVATITEIGGVPAELHDVAKSYALSTLINQNDQDMVTTIWAETHGLIPSRSPINKTIELQVSYVPTLAELSTYTVTLKQDSALPEYSEMSKMHKDHYLSHRSSHAPASRAALALEQASQKTSVTFINLAMVGATVNKGMLGTYTGIETERFWSDGYHMDPQLDQLKNLIGNRKVDALVISVGGNDAGFANALAGLVARDTIPTIAGAVDYVGPSYSQIEESVMHGNWAAIENDIRDIFCQVKCNLIWSNLDGINGLGGTNGLYSAIKKRMGALGINVIHTYITEYPDLTRNGQGETCNQVLNTIRPDSVPGGLEIDKAELQWSREHVVGPLNDAVRSGAALMEWILVDGINTGTLRHGLCAPRPYNPVEFNDHVNHVPIQVPSSCSIPLGLPSNSIGNPPCTGQWEEGVCTMNPVRWFRDENEGAVIENLSREGNTLTAHPNEFGYALVGAELLKKICPNLR